MAISGRNILSYTNQDYDSILAEIMETKHELMPQYTDDTDTDFGNLILTYMAMLFDILSNKLDYSVNEAIPMLCETMKAMYKHCKWIGYRPVMNRAATATFEVVIVNNLEIQSITKGSQITMEDMVDGEYVVYEVSEDVDCTAPDGVAEGEQYTVQFDCIQGETVEEEIGVSDGSEDQQFYLNNNPYIEGSLEIEVVMGDDDSEFYKMNENNSFVGVGPNDKIIVLVIDSDGMQIRFGDGINGKIPDDGSSIVAHYRVGGGTIGNRSAGVINYALFEMPDNFISIQNITEAQGGEDAEDVDEIKDKIESGQYRKIYSLMRQSDFESFLSKPQRMLYIEKFKVCKDAVDPLVNHVPIAFYIKMKDSWELPQSFVDQLSAEMEEYRLIDDVYNFYPVTCVNIEVSITIKSDGLTNEDDIESEVIYTIQDYIKSLKIGGTDTRLDDFVGLYGDDIRSVVREIEGVRRFISLNKLDVKANSSHLHLYSKDEVSENVYDMVLNKGQMFNIEDIDNDVIVEFV